MMISKFYYFRDQYNRPIVTLCMLKHDHVISYGWAVCSEIDNPCKKIGRKIAWSRANTAMLEGQGVLLDNTQNILCWKRRIRREEAVCSLARCNRIGSFIELLWRHDTTLLPASMQP